MWSRRRRETGRGEECRKAAEPLPSTARHTLLSYSKTLSNQTELERPAKVSRTMVKDKHLESMDEFGMVQKHTCTFASDIIISSWRTLSVAAGFGVGEPKAARLQLPLCSLSFFAYMEADV